MPPKPAPDLSLRETYLTERNLAAKTAQWLEALRPYNSRKVRFRIDRAALLVIDMQRFFLEPEWPLYTANGRAVIPRVRALLEHFRRKGRPVIFASQQNRGQTVDRGPALRLWFPTVPLEGAPQTEIVEQVAPLPTEKVILKRRYSAFYGTDLELTLRSSGIGQLVICGLFTNVCLEAAARDAFMRDFLVFIPLDACASFNEELHLGALRTLAYWYAKVLPAERLIRS